MTTTTPEYADRGPSAASAKRPYVAPFLRQLDLEDSEGKTSGDPDEIPPTFGPS
jgi:hypothetical protein